MVDDLPKSPDPAAMWNRVEGDALVASLRGLSPYDQVGAAVVGIKPGRRRGKRNFLAIRRVLRNRRVLVS